MRSRGSTDWLICKLAAFALASIFLASTSIGGPRLSLSAASAGQTNTIANDEPNPSLAKQSGLARRGVWGGEHISLTVGSKDAKLEYDCAHGTIDQPLKFDNHGRFNVSGTHTWESGGPDRGGRKPDTHPARYSGSIKAEKMVLTVILKDSDKPVGTFNLTFGHGPNLFKCK